MKLAINEVYVGQGPLYEVATEDGIGHFFAYIVHVVVGKNVFAHPHAFRGEVPGAKEMAEVMAGLVEDRGIIDVERWELLPPYRSYAAGEIHEAELMDDEERVRRGY